MDFETYKVSGRLPCTPDLDDFHDHHVLVPDQGFFHIEVGIADGTDTHERILLKGIGVKRDKDRLAMIDERLAVCEERDPLAHIP